MISLQNMMLLHIAALKGLRSGTQLFTVDHSGLLGETFVVSKVGSSSHADVRPNLADVAIAAVYWRAAQHAHRVEGAVGGPAVLSLDRCNFNQHVVSVKG